jgi:hypothetical protein
MRDLSIEALGRSRTKSAAALLLLLLLGIWLAWAPPAHAGDWVQVTCSRPDGQPAPIEGWQGSSNGTGAGSGTAHSCENTGGALTAFDSSKVEETAYTGPLWTYTAPAGSTISGGTLKVEMRTPQGQAYVATPQNSLKDDTFLNCQYNIEPCASSGVASTWTIPSAQTGGRQLFMTAFCVAPHEKELTCPAGSGGGVNAEIHLTSADIELATSSKPGGTGFSGSLLKPNATGTAGLTFTAKDLEGPGVYRVIVDVDGSAVYEGTPDTNDGHCASIGSYEGRVKEFLSYQPCSQEVEMDVPVNTSKLTNGSHQLQVTVQDAAGDSSTPYDNTITVGPAPATSPSGSGSPGGTTTGGSSTGGSGEGGEGGAAGSTTSTAVASLVTSLASTSIGPGSPLSLRGPVNGTSASDQANLTARWTSTAKESRTSGYGALDRISGRLSTIANAPIGGAGIDVYETPAYHGATASRLGSVVTGPTGVWTLTLPRGVSSTSLLFSYRSHLDDTVASATATLRLSVHAGIALRITPRTASVGRKIFFSGVVHGAPIPEGGKQLVLEARSGRGAWIQFNTVSTDAKGRYHASYRFKFPGPVTYRFRVVSRYEADFPFLEGTSAAISVHEH